jgi:hypothetical protein
MKLLEENIRGQNCDTGLCSNLLAITPIVLTQKAQINRLDCIKVKNFCTLKEPKN